MFLPRENTSSSLQNKFVNILQESNAVAKITYKAVQI
jgi:hypothetical protein